MEATVNYLLQSGIALLVLYLFYRLLLRNEPSLLYNRLYLLLAPVVALLIPLLELSLPLPTVLPAAEVIPAIQLQEIQVFGYAKATNVTTPLITTSQLALILYSLVGIGLLLKLGTQLLRIRQLKATALPVQTSEAGATLLQTSGQTPAFAFLHYVFLGDLGHLSEKEREQVLRHELAHVRLRHTYDVLYYEVLTALLWFNPLVWLLKTELRDLHEFQADADVLTNAQPQEYSALLAKEALYMAGIPVGSYFQKPQVLRRLRMLQLHGKPASTLRPMLAIPVVLLLTFTFSVKNATADVAPLLEEPVTLTEILVMAPARKAGIPIRKPDPAGIAKEQEAAPIPTPVPTETKKELKLEAPSRIAALEESTKEKPYTYVEQMPAFEGGDAGMMQYLSRNIRYPRDAQEEGAEGLVILSFVVDRDGQLHDISVMKSLHASLDAEALRVVEGMQGKWTAGSQNGVAVPVRYTLPVRFGMK